MSLLVSGQPLTSVDGEGQLAEMKEKLGMGDGKSLKVAVSSKDMNALKADVTTKLGEVAVMHSYQKLLGSKQF